MIIKLRSSFPDGWLWIDDVSRIQTYGQLIAVGSTPIQDGVVSRPEPAIISNLGELAEIVDAMWGPHADREFSYEVWPEIAQGIPPTPPTTVECVRVEHHDGRKGLVLIADAAYLLSDDGSTIDRLR